ncbi:MAG: PLP-dependent aminotransferase family protein [Lachnospiraceae bacterium]|nr:PLP-dependent aminotransferase family protein [Lachnospiraceae bacterium]
MLTYSFENKGSDSLYEYLYKQIKKDILSYTISAGEKLPSKRTLAKNLNISTITVENAYAQLMAEGYIYSVPKSGFYVSDISSKKTPQKTEPSKNDILDTHTTTYFADFVNNSTQSNNFPFSTWTKIMREIMSDMSEKLMVRSPSSGVPELRQAISNYLYQFRGINVEPEQIIVGAGTEYLYGLIIQLLGQDKTYAIEDPGYQKISKIYDANKVKSVHIGMDESGIDIKTLESSGADILHISPSHHFPTGIVTPISRRYEILSWASKSPDRYIIEDDYDSEFRLLGKPIPSLQSIDVLDKVIYMNTFSKSLSSTIRISYMVLPKPLIAKYNRELSFYSCTVSNFEQYTLARFIEAGHLEKHINRMRNYYRGQRDAILEAIKSQPDFSLTTIKEENSGLHFLLEVNTKLPDETLISKAKGNGINISCLSQYYYQKDRTKEHTIIINYSGLDKIHIEEAIKRLYKSLW